MKQADVFPSKYVKAEDLKGRSVAVVISYVVLEKIGNDMKPAAYFQGKEKGVILNKTNFSRIAFCYGDESDNWTGKEIVLYPELVDFQGKPTWSIRVRPPEPRTAAAPIEQNGNYTMRKTSGVTLMEHNGQPKAAERVPGSAATEVDLDQEIPF